MGQVESCSPWHVHRTYTNPLPFATPRPPGIRDTSTIELGYFRHVWMIGKSDQLTTVQLLFQGHRSPLVWNSVPSHSMNTNISRNDTGALLKVGTAVVPVSITCSISPGSSSCLSINCATMDMEATQLRLRTSERVSPILHALSFEDLNDHRDSPN